ncbi:MAG: hypothetical protein ABIN91_07110 [Mucilaginibacter sp.]|uniref:hypothetical protein n=1 Tax=Mucilaginibacter sp. TaxID=1882438 RepID=UPI003263A380
MNLQDEPLANAQGEVQKPTNDTKPNAYRVDDDKNADEASLRKNYIIGGEMKDANAPGMEGEGMGGHKFGGTSHPPTGDDPANPSQNAGYTNAYFAKTEPSEEAPENNNFKNEAQQGEPDYQTGNKPSPHENNEQEIHHESGSSTSDAPELPGPGEKPEQQKVGGA